MTGGRLCGISCFGPAVHLESVSRKAQCWVPGGRGVELGGARRVPPTPGFLLIVSVDCSLAVPQGFAQVYQSARGAKGIYLPRTRLSLCFLECYIPLRYHRVFWKRERDPCSLSSLVSCLSRECWTFFLFLALGGSEEERWWMAPRACRFLGEP